MADLSRLNDGERRILALLAQGHTVKSIANATGWTVAAVNERLRSARQKSGVGSSRELARLYAEYNRPGPGTPVAARNPAPETSHPWWMIIAAIALILLAAVAAGLSRQSPHPSFQSDPMIGDFMTEEEDLGKVFEQMETGNAHANVLASQGSQAVMRRLHSKVRAERRDNRWSPGTEASLRRIFSQVRSLQSPNSRVRVLCSANFCEVTATLPMPPFVEGALFLPEFQDSKQESSVEALGLKPLVKILGRTDPSLALYLSYWSPERIHYKTNGDRP